MEVRKEMPEEVKNQVIDGKKRVVTIPIPKKEEDIIAEKKKKRNVLAQNLYKLSYNVLKGKRELVKIQEEMENLDAQIGTRIRKCADKLKLKKQPERQWRFDGKASFIGVYNPPKKDIKK